MQHPEAEIAPMMKLEVHAEEDHRLTESSHVMEIKSGHHDFEQKSILLNSARAAVLGIGGFYLGYYMSIMNVMGNPICYNILGYTKKSEVANVVGNFNLIYSAGAAIGVLLIGPLVKYIGRIRTILLCEVLLLLSILSYSEGTEFLIYAARVLSGFISALNQVIGSVAIVELLPQKIAGGGNVFIYFCICIGILVCNLMPLWFTDNSSLADNHIWILGGPILITVIRVPLLLAFFGTWETPNYYFEKQLPESQLRKIITIICCPIYSTKDLHNVVDFIVKSEMNRRAKKITVSLLDLFSKRYIKRFLIAIFINTALQMSGVSFLVYYSTTIFDELDGSGTAVSIILSIAKVVGAALGIVLVGKLGRRMNLQLGIIAQFIAFSVMVIAMYYKYSLVLKICIALYMLGFAIGLGGVTTLFCSEIVPAVGVGISAVFFWISASLVGKICPILVTWQLLNLTIGLELQA